MSFVPGLYCPKRNLFVLNRGLTVLFQQRPQCSRFQLSLIKTSSLGWIPGIDVRSLSEIYLHLLGLILCCTVDEDQCDQMDILFIQYLAVYNNENLPNSIIIGPSRFKILPSTKLTLQKLPKNWNFWPKWRNFVKSGHTDEDKCFKTGQLPSAPTN